MFCRIGICDNHSTVWADSSAIITRMFKEPNNLLSLPDKHRAIKLDGCNIIESCHYGQAIRNSMFVSEHLFLFLFSGKLLLETADEQIVVKPGEAVFIRKAHYLAYEKVGYAEDSHYESLLFFLDDKFIKEFLKLSRAKNVRRQKNTTPPVFKVVTNLALQLCVESVKNYFGSELADEAELARLKILEILFILTNLNEKLAGNLYEFSAPIPADLAETMNHNFTLPATLTEFAYLTGRSLSKFKRDFEQVFQFPPSRWLREKRLNYAHRLLTTTDMNVSDVCIESGFENFSHFSRIFKDFYGKSPSDLKRTV